MNVKILKTQLPENPQAVIFVNGIKARSLKGWLYMWRNLHQFRSSPKQISGLVDIKAGIIGPAELVIVSYWETADALKDYFKSEPHRKMMRHFYHHLDDLELYNETYTPSQAGKYNAQHGMAKLYPLA